MAVDIDSLEIQIKADSKKASDELDKLTHSLETLSNALSSINATGIEELGRGVEQLGNAMKAMKGVSTKSFEKLANNINKLANVNFSGIQATSNALNQMSNSINAIPALTDAINSIRSLANSIGALGSVKVERAIANIPTLANSLINLMNTLSRAPTVSRNVIDLVNALGNLASQGAKVGTSAKLLTGGLDRTSRSMSRTKHHAKGLASAIGKFYATWFIALRSIKKLWSETEKSMDYVETYNYYNTALSKIGSDFTKQFEEFGGMSAEAYAESFGERLKELNQKMTGYLIGDKGELTLTNSVGLGLDIEQLMNYQAQLMGVTNAVGLVGETSINTSKALSMLAGDISSLTNRDLSAVMKDLQSGLIGQSRALYKYGIDITNNTLQQKAYALGIEKSVSAMSQSEKMQLRILAILEQSQVSWTDLASTINSVANMFRQFKAAASNLGRTLGNLFLPIVQEVLPKIVGLTIALNDLLNTIGFNIYGKNWLTDLQDGISGFSAIEDAADDLGEELDNANDSLDELVKGVRGFDELNVINKKNSMSTGNLVETLDLIGEIQDAVNKYEQKWNEAYEHIENRGQIFADKIKEIFSNNGAFGFGLTLAESLASAFDKIQWTKVKKSVKKAAKKIAYFINGIFDPESFKSLGKTIAEVFNTGISSAISFIRTTDFERIGTAISNGINETVKNFHARDLAIAITEGIRGALKLVTTILKKTDFALLGRKIAQFLVEIDWLDLLADFAKAFYHAMSGALNAWSNMFDAAPIETAIITAVGFFKFTSLGSTLWDKIIKAITPYFKSSLKFITDALTVGLGPVGIAVEIALGALFALGIAKAFEKAPQVIDEEAEKLKNQLSNSIAKLSEAIESGNEKISEVDVNYDSITKMLDTYYELSQLNFDDLSEGQKALLKALSEELVEYVGDDNVGIKGKINEVTGAWEGTKEALRAVIDTQYDYYRSLAYEEAFVEASKELAKAEADLALNKKKRQDKVDDLNDAEQRLLELENQILETARQNEDATLFANGPQMEDLERFINDIDSLSLPEKWFWLDVIGDSKSDIDDLVSYMDSLNNSIAQYDETIYSLEPELDDLKENVEIWEQIIDETSANVKKQSEDVGESYVEGVGNGINDNVDDTIGVVEDYADTITDAMKDELDGEASIIADGFVEDFNDGIDDSTYKTINEIESWGDSVVAKFEYYGRLIGETLSKAISSIKLPSLEVNWVDVQKQFGDTTVTIPTANLNWNIPKYATGGFPEDGFFFANHNELVGQFDNGRTAVANNDQITTGIENAAYRGFKRAMAESNGSQTSVNVTLEGDARDLFNVVQKESNVYYKRNGKRPFPI